MSLPENLCDQREGDVQFSYLDRIIPGHSFYERFFTKTLSYDQIDRYKEDFAILLQEVLKEK